MDHKDNRREAQTGMILADSPASAAPTANNATSGVTKGYTIAKTYGRTTVDALCDTLRDSSRLSGIRFNQIDQCITATNLPWNSTEHRWNETDASHLYCELERAHGHVGRDSMRDALNIVAHERTYNPILRALENLPEWDGIARAESIFIDFLGACDEDWVRNVSFAWMCGAIERIYTPGTQFDIVPILVGPQGIGKSSLLRLLSLHGDWFCDSLTDVSRSKETGELLRGKWIVELPELTGIRGRDIDAVKAFVSRREDEYREAYGRHAKIYPRTCVFAGTTNRQSFLNDTTGGRRWAPIPCAAKHANRSPFDRDARQWIEMAWAEVISKRNQWAPLPGTAGQTFGLTLSAECQAKLEEIRANHEIEDPFTEAILGYLETRTEPGNRVCVRMLADEALCMDRQKIGRGETSRISEIMDSKAPGWHRMSGKQRVTDPRGGNSYGPATAWEYAGQQIKC